MTIAIDYDGTITSDLKMFTAIIHLMKEAGHTPIIVTMRYPHEEDSILNNMVSKMGNDISVYYTGRKAKKAFMAEIGIFPAIWIDDNPNWIYQDSI